MENNNEMIRISRAGNILPFLEFSGDDNPAHHDTGTAKRILDEFGIICDLADFIISPGMNTLLHIEDLIDHCEELGVAQVTFSHPLIISDERKIIRKMQKERTDEGSKYNIEFYVKEPDGDKKVLEAKILAGKIRDYIGQDDAKTILEDKELLKKPIIGDVGLEDLLLNFCNSYSKDVIPRLNFHMIPACFFPPAMLKMIEPKSDTYKIYAKQTIKIDYDTKFNSFDIYGKVVSSKKGLYKIALVALSEQKSPIVYGEALAIEREFKKI